jgi:hypothetical protein
MGLPGSAGSGRRADSLSRRPVPGSPAPKRRPPTNYSCYPAEVSARSETMSAGGRIGRAGASGPSSGATLTRQRTRSGMQTGKPGCPVARRAWPVPRASSHLTGTRRTPLGVLLTRDSMGTNGGRRRQAAHSSRPTKSRLPSPEGRGFEMSPLTYTEKACASRTNQQIGRLKASRGRNSLPVLALRCAAQRV